MRQFLQYVAVLWLWLFVATEIKSGLVGFPAMLMFAGACVLIARKAK